MLDFHQSIDTSHSVHMERVYKWVSRVLDLFEPLKGEIIWVITWNYGKRTKVQFKDPKFTSILSFLLKACKKLAQKSLNEIKENENLQTWSQSLQLTLKDCRS